MASLKTWLVAARLRTLPLAISGILVGTVLALRAGAINYQVFGFTMLTAVLLQVLSNFANDYGDAVSGIDADNREGPQRMVQAGAITKSAMMRALVIFSIACLLSGCGLLFFAFGDDWARALIFFLIGIAAIAAAIKYTVGKNPYGYIGLGDVFVFLFFGVVAVMGTFFLQVRIWDTLVLLPAMSIGLFSVGVLNVNNIRDIVSDQANGKNSIPVRLGKEKAAIYHAILLIVGMVLLLAFSFITFRSWHQFIYLPAFILLIKNIIAVKRKSGIALDPYLKQMALSTLFLALLFVAGETLSIA